AGAGARAGTGGGAGAGRGRVLGERRGGDRRAPRGARVPGVAPGRARREAMRRLGRGRGAQRRRVFVLGLDGTPYSWLRTETAGGRPPNLAALFRSLSVVPMRSSLPSVSSTAWTTFLTGRDPGGHGLFGFMD